MRENLERERRKQLQEKESESTHSHGMRMDTRFLRVHRVRHDEVFLLLLLSSFGSKERERGKKGERDRNERDRKKKSCHLERKSML